MNKQHERIFLKAEGELLEIDCLVRKSPRARKIRLSVIGGDSLLLTLPKWACISSGRDFLFTQEKWIRRNLKKYSHGISLSKFCSEGKKIWLDEIPRTVTWRICQNVKNPRHQVEADKISLFIRVSDNLEIELLRACITLAKEILPQRLKKCEKKLTLQPGRCRVGNQRSRWGSCSSNQTISLNWRILLLPYELGEYVLFHELAHLKHMNHSAQFWQFLEDLMPNAKRLDRELKDVGRTIIRVGQKV